MVDINNLIMTAMKEKNKVAAETYKLLKAKILEFKTAKNAKEYNDAEEINLINKMISERIASADIYNANGRKDLADAENAQISVLQELLPTPITEEDVMTYLNEHYPNGVEKKQMGLVIKELKNELLGVDGKLASEAVKKILV